MTGNLPWPESAARWLAGENREVIFAADSHTGGNPTRIVLGGVDLPAHVKGVDAARQWLREEADWVRTRLVHEPRGGGLTCAVLPILDPEDGCDIGAVILEPGSYPPMCGHCMIGFASVIVELDLLADLWCDDANEASFRIRTPAGPVGVRAVRSTDGATDITLTNVPSFHVTSGECQVGERTLPVDLVYGGDYYITVDADAIGLSLDRDNATDIVSLARNLSASYTRDGVRDPLTGETLDVYQVMFFRRLAAEPSSAQIVVVAPPGVIDRSPCGTGSSALFALFSAQGAIEPGQTLTTRSIIGSTFTVRSEEAVSLNGREAVVPLLTGRAFVNGFLAVAADARDPLRDGFPPL